MVEEVTKRFFADYMRKDFEITSKFMRILLVIIKASDRVLHQFLVSADVVPFFATAWLLTWFSHVVKTEQEASRIFDVMLASHPLYCYYLCAAVSFVFLCLLQYCLWSFATLSRSLYSL